MNTAPLKQRPILVTGASGGVGKELVLDLWDQGFKRIACQYNSGNDVVDELIELGLNGSHFFKADLTDPVQVARMHLEVLERVGPVWGIVNLAGYTENAMSWKSSAEAFMRVVEANLLTTFLTCREFIPEMRVQQGGRIVNASSVVASSGAVGCAAYCAAKAGIEGLTRALALELAPKEITVNAVAMGYLEVGMISRVSPELQASVKDATPAKRFGHVSEVAGLVRFLLGDEGAFTTGQVLHVNGGYRL